MKDNNRRQIKDQNILLM